MTNSLNPTPALFDETPYVETFTLAERFGVPPFSTLDTKTGAWQARRAAWNQLGLDSGSGRAERLTFAKGGGTDPVSLKISAIHTTSLFDPVLCELIYRWWSPADGLVLDPFAGGSVRGVVAAMLGRTYHGVDLLPDQVTANQATAARLADRFGRGPQWYVGNSAAWLPDVEADLLFTCPPYGTLERYSDEPEDLSTMRWPQFALAYQSAINRATDHLRNDRFAVFVVGNYREGEKLRDLVGLTVRSFEAAGLDYFADLVLLNSLATAGIRASSVFNGNRKPTMTHQHVAVFVKGDWRKAARAAERIDPREAVTGTEDEGAEPEPEPELDDFWETLRSR